MMNLSHVEDEPEPQTTRFAQFSLIPRIKSTWKPWGWWQRGQLGGWDKGEAQQGSRSLVPALAVDIVNDTQILVC